LLFLFLFVSVCFFLGWFWAGGEKYGGSTDGTEYTKIPTKVSRGRDSSVQRMNDADNNGGGGGVVLIFGAVPADRCPPIDDDEYNTGGGGDRR
jgi:hypothetical protein